MHKHTSLRQHILTIAYFLSPSSPPLSLLSLSLPLSRCTLTFSGVLASVPKVRQIAGAQEQGGVRRVIGARPIIETRIVFFTD